MKRKMIYALLIIIGLPVIAAIFVLGYLQITEYWPADIEKIRAAVDAIG